MPILTARRTEGQGVVSTDLRPEVPQKRRRQDFEAANSTGDDSSAPPAAGAVWHEEITGGPIQVALATYRHLCTRLGQVPPQPSLEICWQVARRAIRVPCTRMSTTERGRRAAQSRIVRRAVIVEGAGVRRGAPKTVPKRRLNDYPDGRCYAGLSHRSRAQAANLSAGAARIDSRPPPTSRALADRFPANALSASAPETRAVAWPATTISGPQSGVGRAKSLTGRHAPHEQPQRVTLVAVFDAVEQAREPGRSHRLRICSATDS